MLPVFCFYLYLCLSFCLYQVSYLRIVASHRIKILSYLPMRHCCWPPSDYIPECCDLPPTIWLHHRNFICVIPVILSTIAGISASASLLSRYCHCRHIVVTGATYKLLVQLGRTLCFCHSVTCLCLRHWYCASLPPRLQRWPQWSVNFPLAFYQLSVSHQDSFYYC